ncbi:hypothetical protein HanXRQr2_Chr08g0347921 [Helianthus annuus]|uniref:Uncharacterized protein n=1 Tax=Helianthus annuus TaxID=4232 RepID=A0A251U8M3_HELAN|nr:hypothetical protein HanXRQr2_Chr08g0347921 [Helianthus annuus]KAJ0902369.1 hypothetical protein HanPSC8_Chr08g0336191 [Helianthus annuus]
MQYHTSINYFCKLSIFYGCTYSDTLFLKSTPFYTRRIGLLFPTGFCTSYNVTSVNLYGESSPVRGVNTKVFTPRMPLSHVGHSLIIVKSVSPRRLV